ncbi:unnamed protein product [Rangifer tarandus platyrhynchus]|uniref:Uncharacterized protein n=1 Tax=Rangifer tarandus platyrhynchus TaxID=3082113 RepID=A0AC59ZAJ3_RANTA
MGGCSLVLLQQLVVWVMAMFSRPRLQPSVRGGSPGSTAHTQNLLNCANLCGETVGQSLSTSSGIDSRWDQASAHSRPLPPMNLEAGSTSLLHSLKNSKFRESMTRDDRFLLGLHEETGRQRVLPPTPHPRDLAEEGLESWAGDVFWGPRPLPSFLPLTQDQEGGPAAPTCGPEKPHPSSFPE